MIYLLVASGTCRNEMSRSVLDSSQNGIVRVGDSELYEHRERKKASLQPLGRARWIANIELSHV